MPDPAVPAPTLPVHENVGERETLDERELREAAPATTTIEEDRHSFSQRRINLIWEVTQAIIAVLITVATILGSLEIYGLKGSETVTNAFFLIVGFYFGRTNHQRVGGVLLGR